MTAVGRLLSIAGLSALALIAGCGDGTEEETPVACLEGRAAYLDPQRAEPPVSECLTANQQGGDLANVGETMVAAATRLNSEARADPSGPAAFRLGYLVGAAERGAAETEGIHADLLRRLRAAALYSRADRGLPATVLGAYRRGVAAGLSRG
jgi:hypothetical protein